MAEEPVVVEIDFRVRRKHVAGFREHERIDLDEIRTVLEEELIDAGRDLGKRLMETVGQLRRQTRARAR